MSIAAMNWAWQLRLKPTIKFVLMALADAADDEDGSKTTAEYNAVS